MNKKQRAPIIVAIVLLILAAACLLLQQQQVQTLTGENATLQQTVSDLETSNQVLTEAVTCAQDHSETDAQIAALNEEISAKNTQIETLTADAAGYQADITAYQSKIAGYKTEIAGYQAEISGYQAEITAYQSEIAGYQADIASLQADIAARDALIDQLSAEATAAPSAAPTEEAAAEITAEPTEAPAVEITAEPTVEPTAEEENPAPMELTLHSSAIALNIVNPAQPGQTTRVSLLQGDEVLGQTMLTSPGALLTSLQLTRVPDDAAEVLLVTEVLGAGGEAIFTIRIPAVLKAE